jgi:hypothetical protein
VINDVKEITYKPLTFGILRNSRLPNEWTAYFIMINCNSRHMELLRENNINLLSVAISIRSLILAMDVSINKVTAMAINMIRNFASPINFGCTTFNFCKYRD